MYYFVFQKVAPLSPVVDFGRGENPFKDQRVKVEGGIHGSLHLLLIASSLEEVEKFVESLQGEEVIIIHGSVIMIHPNDFNRTKETIHVN